MNDRAFFSASPALCSIREREAEQRDLGDCTLLCPGKTAIGGPIGHAPLPRYPSGLRIGKAHSQEIGQLRAVTNAGQRAIGPFAPAICSVENRARVPDSPPDRRIRKIHIEECDSALRLLWSPGHPSIVRHQDGSHCPNHCPMLRGEKLYAIEGCTGLTRLINPMGPAIFRMKNGSVPTNHPSLAIRHKREAVERYLDIDKLRMPGIPTILASEDRSIGSDGPAMFLVVKKDTHQARCGTAADFLPILSPIDRLQNRTAGSDNPAEPGSIEIESHQEGFRMAYLRGDRQRGISSSRGRSAQQDHQHHNHMASAT